MAKAGEKVLPGKVAFLLSDTFGFPIDLTRVICAERGLGVDEAGYEKQLAEQRARSEWKGSGETAVTDLHKQIASELGETRFVGYDAGQGPLRDPGAHRQRRQGDERRRQGGQGGGDHGAHPLLRRVGRPDGRHRHDRVGEGEGQSWPTRSAPSRGWSRTWCTVTGGRAGDRRRGGADGRRPAARPHPRQPLGDPPAAARAAREARRPREAGRLGGRARTTCASTSPTSSRSPTRSCATSSGG